MREGAKEVWARARFDFINSDYDKDDAAALLYAALDADRRGVPVLRSDAVFVEYASQIIKADRFLSRPYPEKYLDEQLNPGYTRGSPPIVPNSLLRQIAKPHQEYLKSSDEEKQQYHRNIMSGRFEYDSPDEEQTGTQDMLHHDSHPIQQLNIFRYRSKKDRYSPFNMLMRSLYHPEGGGWSKIYSEGERKHEQATLKSKHPHHSPTNLGQYTGNITLDTLHERGKERWLNWYRGEFQKEPKNPDRDYFNFKLREWDGYNALKCYDADGELLNDEDMAQAMLVDPSMYDADNQKGWRMGRNAFTYGVENLSPQERHFVGQWVAEGKPQNAKHIFDANGMGKDSDWIPFLKRQELVRLSREAHKARTPGISPGIINQRADHSGTQAGTTSVADANAKTIERSLSKLQLDKNGDFSHYGSPDSDDQMSAYEWIRKQAFEKGLMGNEDIDESVREYYGLPNMAEDGTLHYKTDKHGHHISDKEKNDNPYLRLAKYAEMGLLPVGAFTQLTTGTEENQNSPYITRAENSQKAGEMIRDGMGSFVHNINNDGDPSFSWIFGTMHGDTGGHGLDPNALLYADDEIHPGLFTESLPGDFMPMIHEGREVSDSTPQERFDAQKDMFAAFQEGTPNLGGMGRQIREAHRGTRNVMASDVMSNTEQQAHHRLHQQPWKSVNRMSINGDVSRFPGGVDPHTRGEESVTSTKSRGKLPVKYGLMLALSGAARHLDDTSESQPHWIVDTSNLQKTLQDSEFWNARGGVPFVDAGEDNRLNEEQLRTMLGDMGVLTEMRDIERGDEPVRAGGTASEDYYGGFNVYNTAPPATLAEGAGDWSHFENVLGQDLDKIDPTQSIATFDPRHFIASDQNHGHELSNLGREDTARHLMDSVHSSTLPPAPVAPPSALQEPTPVAPPIDDAQFATRSVPLPTPSDPTERGKYVRMAAQQGVWGDNNSLVTPWDLDETDSNHPRNNTFVRNNGEGGVVSYSNPHDLAQKYLEGLHKLYDTYMGTPVAGKSEYRDPTDEKEELEFAQRIEDALKDPDFKPEKMGAEDLANLRDKIDQQQQIVNELKSEYYPMEAADEEEANHQHGKLKRRYQHIYNMNDTMHAIAQVAPKLREIVEKQMPGIFNPEIDAATGEEDWNRANVASYALVEAAERYILGHMTDESNKKLGIGDVMSYHPRPVAHTKDVEPKQPDLHGHVSDRVAEGHDTMLKLILNNLTNGLHGTIAPPHTEEQSIVHNMFKHAAARMNAIRDNPEMAKHEHVMETRPNKMGTRRTAGNKAWKAHVSQKADEITNEELKRIIHDDPEAFLQSLEQRHRVNFSTGTTYDEEGSRRSGLGEGGAIGIQPQSNVHHVSARDENKALKSIIGQTQRHILGNTNWETPRVRGQSKTRFITDKDGNVLDIGQGYKGRGGGKMGEARNVYRNLLQLKQPIQKKTQDTTSSEKIVPLRRVIDGKHAGQPHFTNPQMVRMAQHMVTPPFSFTFDNTTGEPFLSTDSAPMPLLRTHDSLVRHVSGQPNLMPMRADSPMSMKSMSDLVTTGLRGGDFGEWARPYFKKPIGYRRRRFKDYIGKGHTIESLTFLKEDDERKKGDASPIKAAHRIFDLSDIDDLRGFSGSWVVSAWPEGQRVRITREDDSITTTGASIPNEFNDGLKNLHKKNFTVDAIYDGQHLHIVDLLKIGGEDVTDEQMKDRIRALRSTFESTEKIKTPQPVNTRQTDDKGLKGAVDEIEGERVMLRDADSTYMDGEARHPKWVLLDNEKRVAVIILGERGTTRTVYRLGVGPISDEEGEALGNRAHKLNGKYYMDVGTADGDGSFEEGDHATVTVGSVTRRERDGHTVFSLNGAKLQSRAESNATDSTQTLGLLAKSGVPQIPHTVSVQGVNIVVSLPSVEDDVIYKAHRLENETGVLMDTWRIGRGESMKGDFSIRLAETVRPCWEPLAALMLKGVAKLDYNPRPERDKKKKEVLIDPRPEKKKPKKIDRNQILKDPIVVKALNLLDALLTKEKMTWTGPKGLAIGLGSEDSAPRGPTELTRPSTLPDFYPTEDDPEKPAKEKRKRGKSTTVTTDEGEKGTLRISEEGAMLELQSD